MDVLSEILDKVELNLICGRLGHQPPAGRESSEISHRDSWRVLV